MLLLLTPLIIIGFFYKVLINNHIECIKYYLIKGMREGANYPISNNEWVLMFIHLGRSNTAIGLSTTVIGIATAS